uniref:M20/M25/M40 family metallo-hydrolase n=1 Tax=Algoriphagus sp. TaxID=1872435 RepID=UPI004047EBAF
MRIFATIGLILIFTSSYSQSLVRKDIDILAGRYFLTGITQLRSFLAIPNHGVSLEAIEQNLDWCQAEFESLGYQTTALKSDTVPYLMAQKIIDPNLPTILVYLQIDGQPVDSKRWNQSNPFYAVLKNCESSPCVDVPWENLDQNWNLDWKIFARSASDSKGPAIAFIQALRIMQQEGISEAFNCKVILDFQEELGSPTLPALVTQNKDLFAADLMLIMDGTRPPGNVPTLTFGARGIATLKLTLFGAATDLHSGQYGNFAPNPVFAMSRLLATMKDENGRVLVPGFYDGIELSAAQKELINRVPEDRKAMLESLGISQAEWVGETYQEAMQYPTLNVRGIQGGWVGEEVRTIIPSHVTVEIDMRLVAETPAERQIQLVKDHLRAQGFFLLDSLPTNVQRRNHSKLIQVEARIGSKPFKTPLDSSIGNWLRSAMDEALGEGGAVSMQATGGSQPIEPFISTLGIPAVALRIPNPDSNIHAPNENLRLGNFLEGLKMCLGVLTRSYER